jgi:hypothetical protein
VGDRAAAPTLEFDRSSSRVQEPEFAGPKNSPESREFPNIHERGVAPVDLGANVNTFAFLGGVPKAIVCDNLKAGVTRARATTFRLPSSE